MSRVKNFLAPFMLFYLRFFARLQLTKINPKIVGVGGASGKSSTTQFIYEILSKKFKVKQGKGKNSETGIPLNILDIQINDYGFIDWIKVLFLAPIKILTNHEKYDFYVVEMGIDSPTPPKNMEYLLTFIKPDIGILTNITLEHSVYFEPFVKSKESVQLKKGVLDLTAKQEGLLLQSVSEKGFTVLNLDDARIKNLPPLKSKIITVSSKTKHANFYISKIENAPEEFRVEFIFLREKYTIKVKQPLPKYFATSFILAIATGFSSGIKVEEAISSIEDNFFLPPGRFSKFRGIKNSTIFDSSYNSSLEPAEGALDVLNDVASGSRRVGILGDMRELGTLSKIQHELLAKKIIKTLDLAVLIGPNMNEYVIPILDNAKINYKFFESFSELKKALPDLIKTKDVVLVKGSQNTLFLERAVEVLLENKSDAQKLCRRGDFWDKKRKESA